MNPPALHVPPDQDQEHLRLLSVFHYVYAGFVLLGIAFLVVHALVMGAIFSNDEIWNNGQHGPTEMPKEVMGIFLVFYLVFGFILVAIAAVNIYSGICLKNCRNRIFSQIVAGFNCLSFPFGTALGIFTFIVLNRQSVRTRYLG